MDTERDLSAPISWDLIERYLANELTEPERAIVERALAMQPNAERLLRTFQATVRNFAERPDAAELERSFDAWHERYADRTLDTTTHKSATHRSPASVRVSRSPRFLWSGLVLATAAIAALWIGGMISRGVPTHSSSPTVYHTALGQRTTVRLADGSTMLLAPATTVTMTSDDVHVAGEAYFTVAPQTTRPFIVRTNNAAVRVLGTRFAVRQYPDDPNSRIVVEDGKVALQGHRSKPRIEEQTILASRMLAVVTDSGVTVTSGIATREYTGWTQGTLVFNRVPLRDVITELRRAYGTDIVVTDSVLAGTKIIAEVDIAHRPVAQILDVLGVMLNARVIRQGDAFVLMLGRNESNGSRDQGPRTRFPQPEKSYGR